MVKQTIDLKVALAKHRAHLDTIEAISKSVTEPMQQVLAFDLEAFDRRLNSWATAAPLAAIISGYDERINTTNLSKQAKGDHDGSE